MDDLFDMIIWYFWNVFDNLEKTCTQKIVWIWMFIHHYYRPRLIRIKISPFLFTFTVAPLHTEKIAGTGPVSMDPTTESDPIGLRDEIQKSAQKPLYPSQYSF